MDDFTNGKIRAYLNNQISQSANLTKSYLEDNNNIQYMQRVETNIIQKLVPTYTFGKEPRWIIIPGLRGIGKTTLLAQVYASLDTEPKNKLFIFLDDAISSLQVSLREILEVYEEILGSTFDYLNML